MIRSFLFTAFLVMSMAGISPTIAGEIYNHNGSLVEVEWLDGDGMIITYLEPRSGLPSSVRRGTILFEGAATADDTIYGTAYIFSSKCGRIGYEVNGQFNGETFYIDGPAPVRNDNCRVVRYEMNRNSRLDFSIR